MAGRYVPDTGDVVWISFDPQGGTRTGLTSRGCLLSPAAYNGKTSLMICCPLTTQIKNYPFEVIVAGPKPGAVLADQIKELGLAQKTGPGEKGAISAAELAEVRAKVQSANRAGVVQNLRRNRLRKEEVQALSHIPVL